MKYESAAFLALVASASAALYTNDVSAQKSLWEDFKAKFGKNYSAEEDTTRFNTFLQNLKAADIRNVLEARNGGSAVHGITKFSDLSMSEFHSQYLTADPTLKTTDGSDCNVDNSKSVDKTKGLVDWSGKLTTAIKDQGKCGSCWAFSAISQVESDTLRVKGSTSKLSAEQVVQCAKAAFGCDGGWSETAYTYIKNIGGLTTEQHYPYTSGAEGVTGTCNTSLENQFSSSISGYCTINGEDKMGAYVQNHGPLSICIDATTWSSYTGGVVSTCGTSVNHCVQIAGVDVKDGYWKVRNQWGTDWGESGYIRLKYGADTCAITHDPTYVHIK